MALQLRWVGEDEMDRVAEVRCRCYGHAEKDLPDLKEKLHADRRAVAGDHLLAERDAAAVGTATAYSMTLWARGAAIPCQGVAWVGTIKTARRRGSGEDAGVGSAIMRELAREARNRRQVISALMPFRVSYYEHFGYGVVERRMEWTLPLSILPTEVSGQWDFFRPEDQEGLMRIRQRMVEAGQCDVERSAVAWDNILSRREHGFLFVERAAEGGEPLAWVFVTHQWADGKNVLRADDWGAESMASFRGILALLGSLRDQYYSVNIVAPMDWQINRLLREGQAPHRPVNHPAAEAKLATRMQCRIMDHKRFLESLRVGSGIAGRVDVGVRETEGNVSYFRVELEGGRLAVKPAASAQFECTDWQWAAIACGDLRATAAVRMGLAEEYDDGAAALLDALAEGPAPFCHEAF